MTSHRRRDYGLRGTQVARKEMVRAVHEQHKFSDVFVSFLLSRNARIQEDLVDQLFNSSEKRLARILLLLAQFGKEGKADQSVRTRRLSASCSRRGQPLAR